MPYKDPKVAKEKAAQRYQKNLDARKEKMRNDYIHKKEAYKKRAEKYKEENADKVKEYQTTYREENREALRENKKKFYKENRLKIIKDCVSYQRRNMDKFHVRRKRYEATDKGKRAKKAYRNNRRFREKHARLGNVFLKETLLIYKTCYDMRASGLDVEVDHIVPICHKDVCGLHVPWNMQIIPMKENRRKSNTFIDSELIM